MTSNYANWAFGMYLEHSCRYYRLDRPVISDTSYDALCVALLEQWQEVTHRLKHLASEDDLRAGTGYGLTYPMQVIDLCLRYPNVPLYKVFDNMPLADKYEEQAYAVICMIKYGSYGGRVDQKDIKRIGDYLRGHPLKPKVVLPPMAPAKPKVVLPPLGVVIPPL